MARAIRFGSTLSFLALASLTAGCATPQSHASSMGFAGKPRGEIGLATRALAALNENNVPVAIDYAQRAVMQTPTDAGFRALLGSAYFAGGRFKSAEAAYKDSLALYSNQPQVVLKLALVEIAQGKSGDALAFLDAARDVLDPADYGLAVALAGKPQDAISVLQTAARAADADARVRQNLALAYALAGDWSNARTIAAQDVPADQLDARIHQWMQMATPGQESAAVAQLTGVTPAAVDPGQPVRLALNKTDTQMAAAASAPAPTAPPVPQTQTETAVQVAEAVPAPAQPAPVAIAEAGPEAVPFVDVNARKATRAATHLASTTLPRKSNLAPVRVADARRSIAASKSPARPAAFDRRNSNAVVQLGAYSSSKSVLAAWNSTARKYRALVGYTPMSARFANGRGTFYRLSVKGFGSVNEAAALCSSLRHSGGSCFVRNVAGDLPVQIASRS